MLAIQAFSNSPKFSLPTKAGSKSEDQVSEVFDLWVRNNIGEQEFNVGATHPEAFETAMAMIQHASKELTQNDEEVLLPGSIKSEGNGRVSVGLHELSFQGKGIVAADPVAVLFVDSTPGADGTTYAWSVDR